MATNLKLGDRLAIIRDGINKGLTPEESIKQYKINKDGGYNAWKNLFKLTTGLDPDLDDRYDYETFFKENPEAAKLLLTGQVSPEILLMYKTPKAVQLELSAQRQQQRGSINDLMDYSQYEKLINNYMNLSASNPSYEYGGRINIYAEGTDDLDTEDTNTLTSATDYNSEWVSNNFPSYIDVTPEELNEFKRYLIEEDAFRSNDLSIPEEYRNLPRTMFVSMPQNFIKKVTPYELKGYDPNGNTTYYILELIDDLLDDVKNVRENQGKESKNKRYRLLKLRLSAPEGIAYEYWKTQQELLKQQEEQGSTTLPEYVVYPGKYEPKSLLPLRIGERKPIEPYADYLISHNDDPFKSPGGSTPTEIANRLRIFLPNVPEYLFAYPSMQPYPLEPWNLLYLQPLGIVPIPNWDIEQVRDNYKKDNSAFLAFVANLMNGIRSGNNTDELMLLLMLPKDYFADPYAGSNYVDTISVDDRFSNNPYKTMANGGKINKFPLGGTPYTILNYMKNNTSEDDARKIASGASIAGSTMLAIPTPWTKAIGTILTLPATMFDIKDTYNDIKNGASTSDYVVDGINLAIDALPVLSVKMPKQTRFSSTSRLANRAARGAIAKSVTPSAATALPNILLDTINLIGLNYKNYIDDTGKPFLYSKNYDRYLIKLPEVVVTPNKKEKGGKVNMYGFGDWITRPLQQLRNNIKLLQNNKLLKNNRLLHLLASQPKNLTYTAPASSTRVESRKEKGLLPIHRNLQKQLAVAAAKTRNFMRYGHADADSVEIKKAELNPDTYLHDEVQPVVRTYIGPDNRTQQERVLGLQRFNNYVANLPEIRAKELLDYGTDKVLSTFMPSKHISALTRDGNYFSNLYDDYNMGVWDLILDHDLAVQFSEDNPIVSLAGNLATDLLTAKGITKGINSIKNTANLQNDIPLRWNGRLLRKTSTLYLLNKNISSEISDYSKTVNSTPAVREPMNLETIIKNTAERAKKEILLYLESDNFIQRIMKDGISKQEATLIANEMYANAASTEGPIIKNLGKESLQGKHSNEFGTVDELYNNGPEASLELMIAEPESLTFRPSYYINPYAENYFEAIYHELGGHGATIGYDPGYVEYLNTKSKVLGDRYLEIMLDWFPHYLTVYNHNLKLKPVRKARYQKNTLSDEKEKYIRYLEDVDEYSTRARAALIAGRMTDDFKHMFHYFTKESLEKLINEVWGISIPVTVGAGFINNQEAYGGNINKYGLGSTVKKAKDVAGKAVEFIDDYVTPLAGLPGLAYSFRDEEHARKASDALSVMGTGISFIPTPLTKGVGAVLRAPATAFDVYDLGNAVYNDDGEDIGKGAANVAIDLLPAGKAIGKGVKSVPMLKKLFKNILLTTPGLVLDVTDYTTEQSATDHYIDNAFKDFNETFIKPLEIKNKNTNKKNKNKTKKGDIGKLLGIPLQNNINRAKNVMSPVIKNVKDNKK